MKHLYTLFFCFLILNTANSQSFTEQGNAWVQNGELISGGFYPIFYFVEGDTLIGDKTYAKVYFNEDLSFGLTDTAYYAAIREVNDSVFIIDSDASVLDERLIYAWDSYEVDTLEITTYPTTILETIDTITLLNGEQHRRFSYTKYYETFTIYNYRIVIEGIGDANENVFRRGYVDVPEFSSPLDLRCFSRNGELLWLNPLYDVDCESLIVSTKNFEKEIPFNLFPNPVQNIVYLEWPNNKRMAGLLNVYSATGILIYTQELNNLAGNHEISTKNWVNGLYFILFISENGEQFVRQLVKI